MLTEKYAGVEVLAFCAGVSDSQPWMEKITEVQPIILCTTGRQHLGVVRGLRAVATPLFAYLFRVKIAAIGRVLANVPAGPISMEPVFGRVWRRTCLEHRWYLFVVRAPCKARLCGGQSATIAALVAVRCYRGAGVRRTEFFAAHVFSGCHG